MSFLIPGRRFTEPIARAVAPMQPKPTTIGGALAPATGAQPQMNPWLASIIARLRGVQPGTVGAPVTNNLAFTQPRFMRPAESPTLPTLPNMPPGFGSVPTHGYFGVITPGPQTYGPGTNGPQGPPQPTDLPSPGPIGPEQNVTPGSSLPGPHPIGFNPEASSGSTPDYGSALEQNSVY